MHQNIKFNPDNPEEYQRQLKRCVSLSKSLQLKLTLKYDQFEVMRKRLEEKHENPTLEYYQAVLINIRNNAGYMLKAEDITTFEYCRMLQQLNKSIEQQKQQSNGRR